MNKQIKLTLPEEVCQKLSQQALAQGLTLASYLRLLIYQQINGPVLEKCQQSRTVAKTTAVSHRQTTWKEIADLL